MGLLQHHSSAFSPTVCSALQALRLWSVMLTNYPQRSEVPLTSLVCATFASVRHDLRAAQDPDSNLPPSEDVIAEVSTCDACPVHSNQAWCFAVCTSMTELKQHLPASPGFQKSAAVLLAGPSH